MKQMTLEQAIDNEFNDGISSQAQKEKQMEILEAGEEAKNINQDDLDQIVIGGIHSFAKVSSEDREILKELAHYRIDVNLPLQPWPNYQIGIKPFAY